MIDPQAIGMNALAAFQMGRQERERTDAKKAFGEYALNPSEQGLNALAMYDPQFVMAERDRMGQAQQQQQQQQRQDLPVIGRLLDGVTDEASYQQSLGIARQYGLDVGQAPPNFDPRWVGNLKTLVAALQTPQGQEALSGAGKQAVDMGYQPGSPEFNTVVSQLVEASLAQPYTGAGGETRLYTPQLGGGGQMQGGLPRVTSPDEAMRLPPGAQFMLPDGRIGTVPGGSGGNVAGGFPGG